MPPYPDLGGRYEFNDTTWSWWPIPDPLTDPRQIDEDAAELGDPDASPAAQMRAAIRNAHDEDGKVPTHQRRRRERAVARHIQRARVRLAEISITVPCAVAAIHPVQGRTQTRRRRSVAARSGAARGPDDGDGDDDEGAGALVLSDPQRVRAHATFDALDWRHWPATPRRFQAAYLRSKVAA